MKKCEKCGKEILDEMWDKNWGLCEKCVTNKNITSHREDIQTSERRYN